MAAAGMRGQPMIVAPSALRSLKWKDEEGGRCVRGVRGGEKKKERQERQTKDERGIKENSQLSTQTNFWSTE